MSVQDSTTIKTLISGEIEFADGDKLEVKFSNGEAVRFCINDEESVFLGPDDARLLGEKLLVYAGPKK